jgi:hypothetical protein
MNYKMILSIVAGVVLGLAVPRTIKTVQAATPNSNRYQIQPVTLENGQTSEKTALMIDTETGQVWRFQATYFGAGPGGKGVATPESFIPVTIDKPPQR